MNKKFRKITGIVTTGALVLSLGTGAMLLSNTTASAAAIDESTQTESARFEQCYRSSTRSEDGSKGMRAKQDNGRENKKSLDFEALIEANLLTEDQVVEIEAFKDAKIETRTAEKELISAMTKEERMTYFEEKKDQVKSNLFDRLVEEGIIETSDAEAIEEFIHAGHEERN